MRKFIAALLLLIPLTISIFFFYQVNAEAGLNWIDDVIFIEHKSTDGRSYGCDANNYNVTQIKNNLLIIDGYYGCIVEGEDFDYLVDSSTRDIGSEVSVYAVRVHGDSVFRYIRSDDSSLIYHRKSDTFLERKGNDAVAHIYNVYRSSLRVFLPVIDSNGVIAEYKVNQDDSHIEVPIDSTITTPSLSANGQFLVVQYRKNNKEMVAKIDTKTGDTTRGFIRNTGQGNNVFIRSVSSNGRWIYVEEREGSRTVTNRFVYDALSCSSEDNACMYRDLKSVYTGDFEYSIDSWTEEAEFSDEDKALTFWGSSGDRYVLSLTQSADDRLDYLALGDSFSSGEGDIDRDENGRAYYLVGTNNGNENCHVSKRSYPFKLIEHWKINREKVFSIACSGALLKSDYYANTSEYLGQNKRLSELDSVEELQKEALNEFIPGRIPQIEFVKKYKPKVLTFTAGGNDVGFANILNYCINPRYGYKDGEVGIQLGTCGYAIKNSVLQKTLYESIDTNYAKTKEFIQKIREVSPQTRIAIIGYPSFVSTGSFVPCNLNAGAIDTAETKMINEMVDYMNEMLAQVAADTSTNFVDITDSLESGRVCEGSEYVTGLWALINGGATSSEVYHPNAKGHERIAEAINRSGVFGSDIRVESGYIPNLDARTSQHQLLKSEKPLLLDQSAATTESSNLLKPGTPYTVLGFSEEINLGTYEAQDDGSMLPTISLKNMPIGSHVLVVSGTGIDDKPVKYYQFIQIHHSLDDMDGDGIIDEHDKCNFITKWYDEETGEDICSNVSLESSALSVSNYKNHSNVWLNKVVYRTNNKQPFSHNSSDVVKNNKTDIKSLSRPTDRSSNLKYKEIPQLAIFSIFAILMLIVILMKAKNENSKN